MTAFLYTSLHEDLASHGYIVVAVEHPALALFVAYEDGAIVQYSDAGRPTAGAGLAASLSQYLRSRLADRTTDLRFVRERLDALDVGGQQLRDLMSGRVGAFGHSSGGLAATVLCQQSPLVDACLNLDGRLDAAPFVTGAGISPPSKPFMYVTKPFRALADSELKAEGITREHATRSQTDAAARDRGLIAGAGPPSYRATLTHATHEAFSDELLLLNPGDDKPLELMRIVRLVTVEFFDAGLKDPRKSVAPRRDTDLDLEVLAPMRAQ